MFAQYLFLLTLATFTLGRAVPFDKRASWWKGLEPYDSYHHRYMELDCESKHNTTFFSSCCHPRLKDVDLSSIPEECLGSDDVCNDDGDDGNTPSAPMNVEPTPPASTPTTSAPAKPSHTSDPGNGNDGNGGNGGSDDGDVLTGSGEGTFFYQNGVAGACGTVHSDDSKVVALDSQLYGNTGEVSKYCGKTIVITNTENGKSVTAIVADACPTCVSWGSVDMSVGAFTEIATEREGEVKIKWKLFL